MLVRLHWLADVSYIDPLVYCSDRTGPLGLSALREVQERLF